MTVDWSEDVEALERVLNIIVDDIDIYGVMTTRGGDRFALNFEDAETVRCAIAARTGGPNE